MALKRITAPDGYPVTLEEIKTYLKVETDDEDDRLDQLIATVVDELDGKDGLLQKALKPQTWELTYDAFPCSGGVIEIPLPPLISVDSIKYDDEDGVEQTLDPATYVADTKSIPGYVVLVEDASWPDTIDAINAVRIVFTAGYADADAPSGSSEGVVSTVPPGIKGLITMVVEDRFEGLFKIDRPTLERMAFPHRYIT